MTTDYTTPAMRLAHSQTLMHWFFPMRNSAAHGASIRTILRQAVAVGKAARKEITA